MLLTDFQFNGIHCEFIFGGNCMRDRYRKLMKTTNKHNYSVQFRTNWEEIHLYNGVDDFIGKPVTLQLKGFIKRLKERFLTI